MELVAKIHTYPPILCEDPTDLRPTYLYRGFIIQTVTSFDDKGDPYSYWRALMWETDNPKEGDTFHYVNGRIALEVIYGINDYWENYRAQISV